jgi:hypothetical protein
VTKTRLGRFHITCTSSLDVDPSWKQQKNLSQSTVPKNPLAGYVCAHDSVLYEYCGTSLQDKIQSPERLQSDTLSLNHRSEQATDEDTSNKYTTNGIGEIEAVANPDETNDGEDEDTANNERDEDMCTCHG